jgi:hypothetical protein
LVLAGCRLNLCVRNTQIGGDGAGLEGLGHGDIDGIETAVRKEPPDVPNPKMILVTYKPDACPEVVGSSRNVRSAC